MYRAITLIILICLTVGTGGCETTRSAYWNGSSVARPLHSTVFNTQQHRILAQSTSTTYDPTRSKWYDTRNDKTPSVAAGYITEQSDQNVIVLRNRNNRTRNEYDRTTYSRRRQKLTW